MQVNNMLVNYYNYNYPLTNNLYYQQQLYQQNIKQQLYQQNMMYNINYTNVNFINQANFVHQNNFQPCYQNSLYNRPNNSYKKQNNKNSNIKPGKKFFSKKKENYKEEKEKEKEENKYFKLADRRRKSSISTDRTSRCDSSFNNSILSEDEKELEKEKGKKEINKKALLTNLSKKNPNYKKKLSNISEASESSKNSNDNDNNSEDDNKDLENSFFSDEEIDDKDENKIENGKKFEKSGKFGKKETQGIQGKKFENEKIFFENEKFEKKVEKNANENNISYKKKEYVGNPALENIEVLRVNVKLEGGKNAVFKLKRYDDVFETIKLFCEINSVDEKLIKPLIIKPLSTLNTIYQIMNSKVNEEQIEIMKKIQKDII